MSVVKSSRVVSYDVSCTVEDQEYTLYTCPDNCRAMMSLLYITNADTGGTTDVSVEWWRDNGARHVHILGERNMNNREFLQFSQGVIVFEPGDYMTITPSGNSSPHIDVLCTVEEIFKPIGG